MGVDGEEAQRLCGSFGNDTDLMRNADLYGSAIFAARFEYSSAMQGPPSLVRFDPAVPAEDSEAKALKAKLKSAKLNDSKSIGSVGNGDILHTILPPRLHVSNSVEAGQKLWHQLSDT